MRYVYEYKDYKIEICSDVHISGKSINKGVLCYSFVGSFEVLVNGHWLKMEEDNVLSGGISDILGSDKTENIMIFLYIKDSDYQDFNVNTIQNTFESDTQLKKYIKKLVDITVSAGGNKASAYAMSVFYALVDILIKNYISFADDYSPEYGNNWQREMEIYIEEHFNEQLSLEQLAEGFSVSYYYLSHNFKDIFGCSFYEFIGKIRLNKALRDLLQTDKNMTEIALDNGYTSSSVFDRNFKKEFGITPSQYRKRIIMDKVREQILIEDGVINQTNTEKLSISLPNQKKITRVDVNHFRSWDNPFVKMINIGHASLLVQAKVQNDIKILQETIKYRYMRVCNPFCEEMEIRKNHEYTNLNFSRLDIILDFLLNNGITPWIEFGDKPRMITDEASSKSIQKQNSIGEPIFRSVKEFEEIMMQFIHHIIKRYGREETEKWVYEFWDDFYRPERKKGGEDYEYSDILCRAGNIIKNMLPKAKVGGCGRVLQDIDIEIVDKIKGKFELDFLSFIFYPYMPNEKKTGIQYDTSSSIFADTLDAINEKKKIAGITTELYITEYSSNVSSRDFQNDSCQQAAWTVFNACIAVDKVPLAGYWCASDNCFIAQDSSSALFGGSGVITKDGVFKPVYYAFYFLKKLKKNLMYVDINGIFTSDEEGIAIILHNYCKPDISSYMQKEIRKDKLRYIKNDEESGRMLNRIVLKNMKDGRYIASVSRIGPQNGGLLEIWRELNYENELSKEEITYMKKIASPRVKKYEIYSNNLELKLDIEMEKQEIVFVKIDFN